MGNFLSRLAIWIEHALKDPVMGFWDRRRKLAESIYTTKANTDPAPTYVLFSLRRNRIAFKSLTMWNGRNDSRTLVVSLTYATDGVCRLNIDGTIDHHDLQAIGRPSAFSTGVLIRDGLLARSIPIQRSMDSR